MENEEIISETIKALQNGQVSKSQYEALEIYISHSMLATVRAKKAILWFLRQSNYLKRSIAMTIPFTETNNDECKFSYEIADAIHGMNGSTNESIDLHDIFAAMGFSKNLSFHSGIAKKFREDIITFETGWDNATQKDVPIDYNGFTIWLSEESYQREVELVEFNKDEVLKTKLRYCYSSWSQSFKEFYEDDSIPKKFLTVTGREIEKPSILKQKFNFWKSLFCSSGELKLRW